GSGSGSNSNSNSDSESMCNEQFSIIGIYTHHPSTGARIAGCTLPHYKDLVNLALSAHRAFREFKAVGWDVVMVESGPSILEGNLGWCTSIIQMPNEMPLGLTDYPRIFVEQLHKRI
ncbi:MAG: sugar-transfer associated ATP-grasp domain-containing protein, partial [Cyanobacteria bacterium P01_F01_bin.153]